MIIYLDFDDTDVTPATPFTLNKIAPFNREPCIDDIIDLGRHALKFIGDFTSLDFNDVLIAHF
jgi:hypothetical protein